MLLRKHRYGLILLTFILLSAMSFVHAPRLVTGDETIEYSDREMDRDEIEENFSYLDQNVEDNRSEKELMEEEEWRRLYEGEWRSTADTGIGNEESGDWYAGMRIDLSEDVNDHISDVAYWDGAPDVRGGALEFEEKNRDERTDLEKDLLDDAEAVHAHVAEEDDGAPGEWLASSTEYEPQDAGWVELDLENSVRIEDPGEYWIVLEIIGDHGADAYPVGGMSPSVEDGQFVNDDDPQNASDWYELYEDHDIDYAWALEAKVSEAPNFEVEIVGYDEEVEVGEDEEVLVEYMVENTGDMEGTQNIEFRVDGDLISTEDDVTLGGEETFEGNFTWISEPPYEERNLTVESQDDLDQVTVTVLEGPFFEVAITEPEEDQEYIEDDELRVNYSVTNTGDREGTQDMEFRVDGDLIESDENVTLSHGDTYEGDFTWVAEEPYGKRELTVESQDDLDQVNIRVLSEVFFEVTITSPEDGTNYKEGEEVEVEYTVVNIGGSDDTQVIEFIADGDEEDTEEVNLGHNDEFKGEFNWGPVSAGEYDLKVQSENDLDEVNIIVVGEAIFEVTELSVDPEEVYIGEEFHIEAEVYNHGGVEEEHTVIFERDETEIGEDTVTVEADSTAVASITDSLDYPGTYNISVYDTYHEKYLTEELIVSDHPEILTGEAEDIDSNSARLKGELSYIGLEDEVGVYFQYRIEGEEDWIETDQQNIENETEFQQVVDGLEPESTYEFRAVMRWGEEEILGEIETFTTVKDIHFDVEIINYDEEVAEGEDVVVEYRVDNKGHVEDTQSIEFRVEEDLKDSVDVTLDPDEVHEGEFSWKSEDPGEFTVAIASEDDEEEFIVTVLEKYELIIESTEGGSVIAPGEGTFNYTSGESVELAAEPEENYHFVSWTGDVEVIDDPEYAHATLTMEENHSIIAEFSLDFYGLEISVDGEGDVEINPEKDQYEHGTEVELTAIPDEGWNFVEWTGDHESDEENITLTMDGDHKITAHFEREEVDIWVDITSPEDEEIFNEGEVEIEWDSQYALRHEIRLNEGEWMDLGDNTTYLFEGLEDGEHTIEVRIVGRNETTEDEVSIIVDTIPPELEITSPEEGEVLDGPELTVEWTGSDDISGISGYEIRLNEEVWIDVGDETSHVFEELEEGEYKIEVRARDEAENERVEEVSFTVEKDEPDTVGLGDHIWNYYWIFLLIPLILIPILLIWRRRKEEEEEEEEEDLFTDMDEFEEIGSEYVKETSEPVEETSLDEMEGEEEEMMPEKETAEFEDEKSGEEEFEKDVFVGKSEPLSVKPPEEEKETPDESTLEEIDSEEPTDESSEAEEEKDKIETREEKPTELEPEEEEEDELEAEIDEELKIEEEKFERTEKEMKSAGSTVTGSKVEDKESSAVDDEVFYECDKCGALVTVDEDECPYCGGSPEREGSGEAIEGKEESVEEEVGEDEEEEKKETTECPLCGKENSADREKCYACGNEFD